MKLRLSKWFYMLGILTLGGALVAIAGHVTKADGQVFFPRETLEGTWHVVVTQVNCQTGDAIGNPFSSYLSFYGNGTLTESTSNPGFGVGQRAPGLGVWHRSGRNSYYAKSIAFMLTATPPPPPPSGFKVGTQTIAQTITFDHNPDEFSSNAAIQFADNTGAVYLQGCAVATGDRFK